MNGPSHWHSPEEGSVDKTLMGAQWIRALDAAWAHLGRDASHMRVALVGRTAADVRDVMLEGPSGLLNVFPPSERDRLIWTPSRRRLELPNGGVCLTYSAEEPSQLRGPQFHIGWCDELAAFKQIRSIDQDATTWENLRIAVRLGKHPQVLATTTPKRVPVLRQLITESVERPHKFIIRRGKTTDNKYLSEGYLEVLESLYGGTALGRQELDGEMLDDVAGAMTSEAIVNRNRVSALPDGIPWIKIVSIDPSVAERPQDECGIVVIYISKTWPVLRRHAFVVEDLSLRAAPAVWSEIAIRAAHKHNATIVAETNQGANLVFQMLRQSADALKLPMPPMKEVWATKAKAVRAEPVGGAYARGRVHHVGELFPELESQITSFVAGESGYSPDRQDACLAAGTMIATERGPVAIEHLVPGALVWTRQGLRPVKAAWRTQRDAQTFLVRTGSAMVRATANHRIHTTRGWQRVDALVQADTLLTWDGIPAKSSHGTIESGSGTRTTHIATVGSITSLLINMEKRSMWRSGATRTAANRLATGTSSITATATPWTTTTPTWCDWITRSTTRRISNWATSLTKPPPSGMNTCSACRSWPSGGIGAMRDALGTANTGSIHGWADQPLTTSANSAARLTKAASARAIPAPDHAASHSGNPREAAALRSVAPSAATCSPSFTAEQKPAVGSAALLSVSSAERSDVWDVEVEDVHEFFADGILVHNCVQGCASGLFPEAITSGGMGTTVLRTVADQHIQIGRSDSRVITPWSNRRAGYRGY